MNREPIVLGIESSCDETGIGIVAGNRLLTNTVSSSMAEHVRFGGVIPEIASRAHLEAMIPALEAALTEADVELGQVDALAVTGGAAAAAYGLSGAASTAGQSAQAGPGGTDGMQGAPGDGAQEGTGQDSAGQGSAGQGQRSADQDGAAAGGGQAGGAPGSAGTGADAAGLGSAGGQPLYSTSVVEQDGKYVTVVSQTGTVQRISADSVTVESADGDTQTYAVSEDSLVEGFSTGDEVRAAGTRDGEDVTLTTLAQAAQSGTQSGTGRSEEDGADSSEGTEQDADQGS